MVSIIIPVYNREGWLSHTLESVLAQTYPEWECIMVDDGSVDRSEEIATSYCQADPRFRFFHRNREPKSANTCRNIGIEKSRGEFILFLDSDDLLETGCLENRTAMARQNPGFDFWVFKMWELRGESATDGNMFLKKKDNILANFLQMKLPWVITSLLWKKSFLAGLGGFDENIGRLQDVELHLRALTNLKDGYKVDWDNKPDWSYRFRSINRDRGNLELLNRKVNSSIYLYKKILPSLSGTENLRFLPKGIKKNFIDLLFENVISDFKGQHIIEKFVTEVESLAILSAGEKRKIRILSDLPKFMYRVPGAYRTIKLILK